MINLEFFQMSFQIEWARKLLRDKHQDWMTPALEALSAVGGKAALQSNVSSKRFKGIKLVRNTFWKEVLCIWLDYKLLHEHVDNNTGTNIPLFNNENITYNKQTLFFSQCISRNIIYVSDLLIEGSLITFNEFELYLNTPNAFFMYKCLYNALKKLQFVNNSEIVNLNVNVSDHNEEEEESSNNSRKVFYSQLNKAEIPNSCSYWSRKLETEFNPAYWMIAINCTSETRLRILHWKIAMAIYPTAVILYKMKLKQNELCEKCGTRENLEHFFFHCKTLQKLWVQVSKYINKHTGSNIVLTWDKVILGCLNLKQLTQQKQKTINLIILIAKLSITKVNYGKQHDPCLVFEEEMRIRNL